MLWVNGVKDADRLSVVEQFWAKAWDLEWAGFRFVADAVLIDTGYENVDPVVVGAWLNLSVSSVEGASRIGWDCLLYDSDG